MADAVQAWCHSFAIRNFEQRVIVITGPFGNGKTTVLRAAKTYVRDVRISVWPKVWPKPAQVFSYVWGDFIREMVEHENEGMREDLMESQVVFLDDIGSEEDRFRSGAPARILGDVLGRLHDDRAFVFITTNIAPEHWRERWDGRVEDRLLRMKPRLVNLWPGTGSYSVWRLNATV